MSSIYSVRTTSGREDIVLDMIETKIKNEEISIKSVVHPAEIKGYVFIEGTIANVHKVIQGLLHVRGIIEKPIKLSEIQRFLEYKTTRITIDLGDVVEIVGGSFKSERGKVTRVDKVKGEVTIELMEASIPIPVTIATEFVKVIKRAKPDKEQEKPRQEARKIAEKPADEEAELTEEEEEAAEEIVEEEAKEEEVLPPEEAVEQEAKKQDKELAVAEAKPTPKEESIEDVKAMVRFADDFKVKPDEDAEDEESEKSLLEEMEDEKDKKEKKKGFFDDEDDE